MKNKFKVFIVEDSMEISQRLKTMLTELDGIEVVGQAKCSRDARELIPRLNPQAVILDGRLPDENGIELLKKIKKNNVALKVIIFSNQSFPQYREKCLAMGADFYFDKATEFEKVPKAITSWAQEFFRAELPAPRRSGD